MFKTIVALSDQHRCFQKKLPPGDILLVAGDMGFGEPEDMPVFWPWIGGQPFVDKVVIAGNNDGEFERDRKTALVGKPEDVSYLEDSGDCRGGLRIWGSPWTTAYNRRCFQCTPEQARAHWALIPEGLDILVTHVPPYGVLDESHGQHEGCPILMEAIQRLKQPPRLHVFGHIHQVSGFKFVDGICFANVAQFDRSFRQTERPFVCKLELFSREPAVEAAFIT